MDSERLLRGKRHSKRRKIRWISIHGQGATAIKEHSFKVRETTRTAALISRKVLFTKREFPSKNHQHRAHCSI